MSNIEPLERQTLGDRVYGEIRELLMSGRLAPGERLSLRTAADALGVSIMPVREAVSRLVADRALEVAPNRAVRVPVLSAEQFRELVTVRIEIEGFAAARAALAKSPEDLELIATAEAAFKAESLSRRPDLERAVELNKSFHFAVYRAAGLPSLIEIIASLWLKAGPVINLDLRENPDRIVWGGAFRRHAEALDAILCGDGDAARTAIAKDIGDAADFILAQGRLKET